MSDALRGWLLTGWLFGRDSEAMTPSSGHPRSTASSAANFSVNHDCVEDSVAGKDAARAARVRAGDIAAFEELFRAYDRTLRQYAYGYLRSLQAAEDIVQEVWLAVWERRADFAARTSSGAYLYSAVRNRAINAMAHDRVTERHVAETLATAERVIPAVDTRIFADELQRVVQEKIDALPPRVREVFWLRRDEGLSNTEIADVLGITVHAVRVQMYRAMKALHTSLAPWIEERGS